MSTNTCGYIVEAKDLSHSMMHQAQYVERAPAALVALPCVANASSITPTYLLNKVAKIGGAAGAGYTVQMPTGTELSAAIKHTAVGDCVRVVIYNTVAQIATFVDGVDCVLTGTKTLAASTDSELVMYCTAAHTWRCYLVKNA